MKIKSIRLENFRSFSDQTIELNSYSCFVGTNGSGKSNILAALNVFFQEKNDSLGDISKLVEDDFHLRTIEEPVRITLTFVDLEDDAKEALAAYVRQNQLVVTAEAIFDVNTRVAQVKHYGQRLGISAFRKYFGADKAKASAADLKEIFANLQSSYPQIASARSKDEMAQALQSYEADNPSDCTLIPSEDSFYGAYSTGKLAQYVQWVYVPAVKNASDEGVEARNTALEKLIARAVRSKTSFDDDLKALREEAQTKYRDLLSKNSSSLTELSQTLQTRLQSWAHPNVRLDIEWQSDANKSVSVAPPVAGIRTGDGEFIGSISRMGHGIQRSYLLALLQELSLSNTENAPTLILGCEEPELYQHPPQARHLSDVFEQLAQENNQILVTTHSPYFITGDGFENIRLVRRDSNSASNVRSLTYTELCRLVRSVQDEAVCKPTTGLVAKLHQLLQPGVAEMFFARLPVLVEGLEDVSYLTTHLQLTGKWNDFRRLGCHLIPANGKDKLIQPLAIASSLTMPIFVMFDADGNEAKPENKTRHEKDNKALISLLGKKYATFPDASIVSDNHVIHKTNIGDAVKADFGQNFEVLTNAARTRYGHEGSLGKNDLFIADWLTAGFEKGITSRTLDTICDAILKFAKSL